MRIELLGPRWRFARDLELKHANEHRTHVLSILGARGHDELRLNVWRHAIATGAMREVAPAAE